MVGRHEVELGTGEPVPVHLDPAHLGHPLGGEPGGVGLSGEVGPDGFPALREVAGVDVAEELLAELPEQAPLRGGGVLGEPVRGHARDRALVPDQLVAQLAPLPGAEAGDPPQPPQVGRVAPAVGAGVVLQVRPPSIPPPELERVQLGAVGVVPEDALGGLAHAVGRVGVQELGLAVPDQPRHLLGVGAVPAHDPVVPELPHVAGAGDGLGRFVRDRVRVALALGPGGGALDQGEQLGVVVAGALQPLLAGLHLLEQGDQLGVVVAAQLGGAVVGRDDARGGVVVHVHPRRPDGRPAEAVARGGEGVVPGQHLAGPAGVGALVRHDGPVLPGALEAAGDLGHVPAAGVAVVGPQVGDGAQLQGEHLGGCATRHWRRPPPGTRR